MILGLYDSYPPAVFNTDVIHFKEFPAHFQPAGWLSVTEARSSVRAVRYVKERRQQQQQKKKTGHITFTDVYIQEQLTLR